MLLALGITGLRAQRTLGDPDTVAGLAGDILRDPTIRTELAVVIVDPVLENAPQPVREQRAFIVTTTSAVLGHARFVPVFRGVLRGAATQLVDGRGPIVLELDRPLELVVQEIEPVSPELAADLAAIDPPEPTVVSAEQADRLRAFLAFQRTVSIGLLAIGVVLVVAAAFRGGAFTLLPFGASLAGACLLVFGMLLVGRSMVLSGIHPEERAAAAADAWNIVIADLRTALLVAAGVGALAVLVGGAAAHRT
jgi:hypothetical protein